MGEGVGDSTDDAIAGGARAKGDRRQGEADERGASTEPKALTSLTRRCAWERREAGKERGDGERERPLLSRAPSEALRRYKKAALGVGGEAPTGGEGGTARERVMDIGIEPI